MARTVSWLEHQGEKILFLDLKQLTNEEEYLARMEEVEAVYRVLKPRSTLVMIDVTGSISTPATTQKQKQIAAYQIPIAASVIGVSLMQRVIANSVNPKFYFARDKAEALEWLTRKEKL